MGLYRYLRRKLGLQYLKGICEDIQTKTGLCLNQMCSIGGVETRLDQLGENVEQVKGKTDQISTRVDHLLRETEFSRRSKAVFGKSVWDDAFYQATSDTDLEEKYDRLISGLAEHDKAIITAILARVQHVKWHGLTNFYQPEESERIYKNQLERLKVARLNDHCYAYKGFKLPINEFEINTFVSKYGCDLIGNPEFVNGKDIIDAGAYIGDSALVFNRYFPKCRKIYSFEPDPKSYALLEKTIAMNKVDKIVPVRLALGKENSEAQLAGTGMGTNLLNRGSHQETANAIKVVRLDDYVRQNNIVPGLIKADLEGFEMQFLNGALDTIRKYRPIMLLSIYHSSDDFFGLKPFIESLDLDYSFKISRPDDGHILCETCLICNPNK